MSRQDLARKAIVDYWRSIEMFSPQTVPAANNRKFIYDVKPGEPLPWEGDAPAQRKTLAEGWTWSYQVYCGTYSLEKTFDVLKRVCGSDPDSYNEREYAESALAGFLVNADGRPSMENVALSSAAWALGRANSEGVSPGWLNGFDIADLAFQTIFNDLLTRPKTPSREKVLAALAKYVLGLTGLEVIEEVVKMVEQIWATFSDLSDPDGADPKPIVDTSKLPVLNHELLRDTMFELLTLTGTDSLLDTDLMRIRISCREVRLRRKDTDPADFDFLNSFILSDLAEVAAACAAGDTGTALCDYLTERCDGVGRIDIRARDDIAFEQAQPNRIPLGRWPSPPGQRLALNQQLAVNNAVAGPAEDITGVNGPPGTGKTTLLRDLIAALITQRGVALSKLVNPWEGFAAEPHRWKKGTVDRSFRALAPELTGFEMVVASSNNGAVENITDELPQLAAIDERWRSPDLDYFSAIGTSVLNAHLKPGSPRRKQAWGPIAAKLGKSANRQAFADAFWWGTPDTDADDQPATMKRQMAEFKNLTPSTTWQAATDRFRKAHDLVVELRRERQQYFQDHRDHEIAVAQVAASGTEVAQSRQQAEQWRQLRVEQQRDVDAAEQRRQVCENRRDTHLVRKPNVLETLFSLGKANRQWRAEDAILGGQLTEALTEWQTRHRQWSATVSATQQAEAALAQAESRERFNRDWLAELDQRQAEARAKLGTAYPVDWSDRRIRETSAPWTDAVFNAARSDLFMEALRLHRCFIEHNAHRFEKGLNSAVDAANTKMPSGVPPEIRLAAWQLLFFVTPVVSTTFSSLGRQFGGLPKTGLGWLLVDEAGQATPQSAIAGIWRSKRVLTVGDPLQLEPIVAVPPSIQEVLRLQGNVAERWLPERGSVQRLADKLTAVGTWLPGPDTEPLWVGTPLSVHRRCDDPMVTISNRVAYGGMMINATEHRAPFNVDGAVMPPSRWLDVSSTQSDGHWIPMEGIVLDKQLKWLHTHGFDMEQVFLISPFRDVATQLKRREDSFKVRPGGTVHTAQGKESDIVILVLGGDPDKPGALTWASGKPNLINVAASRAKRRLYVIGNHSRWSRLKYFDVVSSELDYKDMTPVAHAG